MEAHGELTKDCSQEGIDQIYLSEMQKLQFGMFYSRCWSGMSNRWLHCCIQLLSLNTNLIQLHVSASFACFFYFIRLVWHRKFYLINFYTPVERLDILCEHPCQWGGSHRLSILFSLGVFIRSLHYMTTMFVGIRFRPVW